MLDTKTKFKPLLGGTTALILGCLLFFATQQAKADAGGAGHGFPILAINGMGFQNNYVDGKTVNINPFFWYANNTWGNWQRVDVSWGDGSSENIYFNGAPSVGGGYLEKGHTYNSCGNFQIQVSTQSNVASDSDSWTVNISNELCPTTPPPGPPTPPGPSPSPSPTPPPGPTPPPSPPSTEDMEICLPPQHPTSGCSELYYLNVNETYSFKSYYKAGNDWLDYTNNPGWMVCNDNPPCFGEYAIYGGARNEIILVNEAEYGSNSGVPLNYSSGGTGDQVFLRPLPPLPPSPPPPPPSPIPPTSPSGIQLEAAPCGNLSFSWLDNSNNEVGFRLSYRLAPNGSNILIANVGAAAGSGTRVEYDWGNPPTNTAVWIVVNSYRVESGVNYYSPDLVSGSSYIPQACFPNLTASKKTVYAVNNNTTATTAKDGDVITFRVVIQNNGTDDANITGIRDILHPNPANDGQAVQLSSPGAGNYGCNNPRGVWRLCVDKDGDGVYNEASELYNMVGATPTPNININGTKCTTANHTGCNAAVDPSCTPGNCKNWVVLFSATISTTTPGAKIEIWNEARLDFESNGTPGTVTLVTPKFIVNNSGPKAPIIREVSP